MSTRLPMRALAPVLLTVALDLLGFGLVIPLLSFYSESHGASALQVTLLMATYSAAQFLMAPVWGQLSDRHGRRPVLLFSIGVTASMLLLFALAPSLWVLFVARTLHGAGAANIGTAQALVADLTTPEQRARGMGLVGAAIGVGFTFGPWLGGELSRFGYRAPILAAAALSALNLVWAWARVPEPPRAARALPARSVDPRALLAALAHPVVGLAIALTFAAVFAFSMMEATLPLVAEHRWGWTAADVGRIFFLVGVIGVVVQGGLLGRLAQRFGETALVAIGLACMAGGFGVLALAEGLERWPALIALALGSSLATPSLNSLISRAASDDAQGAVLGANQSMSALARATAPPLAGLLYTGWFDGGALAAGALLMMLAIGLSLPATRRARASLR